MIDMKTEPTHLGSSVAYFHGQKPHDSLFLIQDDLRKMLDMSDVTIPKVNSIITTTLRLVQASPMARL